MRITQLISHYVPASRFGGPQRVAHGIARALVQRGHEVSVCTTNLKDETNDLDVPTDQAVDVDGVSVFYEPTRLNRYWGFSPRLWRRAREQVESADLVLVHFHYQFANWAGAALARRAGTPYCLFAHGSLKRDAIHRKGTWRKRLYLRWLESKNLRDARCIYFNAPEERDNSLFRETGVVLPNGIDPEEFRVMPERGSFRERHGLSPQQSLLLFFGRIDYHGKGLDLLVPAFADAARGNEHLHLVFAGPDERGGQDQLLQAIARHDLDSRVTVAGLLSGQDRLAALRDADAFLLPSRSEGLSIALLEALYVGLPVLVTPEVGLWKLVRESGAGLVVPLEPQALHDALIRLASAENRDAMRGKATATIREQYTWTAIADQLLAGLSGSGMNTSL